MKKFLVVITLAVFLFVPCSVFAQADRVNVHMYSIQSVTEDSSGSNTWLIQHNDIDTSETVNIAIYKNIGSIFKFNAAGVAHADSLEISIYGDVSWNDTSWVMVDSIAACPLSVAELVAVSGTDSSYFKLWTLPASPYFRVRVKAWNGKTDRSDGWNITIRTMKQQ